MTIAHAHQPQARPPEAPPPSPMAPHLAPGRLELHLRAECQREVVRLMAKRAAEVAGLPEREVREAVSRREHLGSTALGARVALPHGRVPGLATPVVLLARLEEPVDWTAEEGGDEPVDLVCLVLVSENAGHGELRLLSEAARLLRAPAFAAAIRGAEDAGEALRLLRAESARAPLPFA